jgi:hypothetical protein
MIPAFRAAGINDEFRINPLYFPQTYPISGRAGDTTLLNIHGCFLYRRKVVLDRDGPALLAFEGVRNQVHAWVNGSFVAFRQGFSTPFELAVPAGILRKGENEIVLAVSNNANTGYYGAKVSGLSTRGPFASTGGVNGHLELRFPKNDLADVYVTTAKDMKRIEVCANANGAKYACEILDPLGKVAARGEMAGGSGLSIPTDGLKFWSPANPVLYTLRVKTPEGGYSQKFGIRRLTAEGDKLFLNGKPVYLRGVTEHCYFPKTMHLPRDMDYYRMILRKRKELGFNFVRFHTYVPPEEYLQAADEVGMLVHIESPNFVPMDEYRSIIAFARRHPSVVIYCAGNETRIDLKAESYLKEVARAVHSETDSLFSPMSAMRGVEYMLMGDKDDIASRPFRHNPLRMARLAEYCDMFTSYQLGATSYDSLNGPSASAVDEWCGAYRGKPVVSHEICIDGGYMNLDLEKDYPKDSPFIKTGFISGMRENLGKRGLLDRAPLYYRNSCEWMRRIRKHAFEKMRMSRRTSGYDFLGDINHHWHTFGYSVGMMDEFYRLKPGETVDNVLRYNSAAVVLSDLGSGFNVMSGEKKRVAFTLSNYFPDAPHGSLRASLVENCGAVVWSGETKCPDGPCGEVNRIGALEVAFPKVDAPKKYFLRVSYVAGSVRAENEWEMYAFPKVCSCASPSRNGVAATVVRVVNDISRDDLVAAMARGERVLLFGAGPFKSLPTTYRIACAGRCSGNFATVVKKGHPALDGLPHEGYCGWQFRWLMEGGKAVQLEAGVPFDPIVEVVSSDKFPIRQAALAEYRVERGMLLVCTFRFRNEDPAAAWLKGRLTEYAASKVFSPALSLTANQLRAVVDAPLLTGNEHNRNRANNINDPSGLVRAGSKAEP